MHRSPALAAKTALACLRLLAMVAFDLLRPSKPENRLPRRWANGPASLA